MIKFLDLALINKRFENQFKKEFEKFINSGQYILGNQVKQFEEEFASYCGTKYCIGVSSGLDALQLIFEAYKILGKLKDDDEVIVPANTYIASVLAISHTGLKPVLVEPDLKTYNIDVAKIEQAITTKTKAILGVHLYGLLYNVEVLETLAKKHNLLLIEDSAQAHGAIYKDERKAGNLSHAAAFSFYPTKNLGALGDGGAITTNNDELAAILLQLRNYGRVSAYKNDLKGFNGRLDELQAAFLRIKLECLDADNDKRREAAGFYLDHISSDHIVLPSIKDIKQHVFHLFVIRSKRRDELKAYLQARGIETMIHYPVPIHKQMAYREFLEYKLPITEQIHEEVLSLPLHHLLSNSSLQKVTEMVSIFK
ncbi:aminotransferase [Yeosuana aromativorans]|uniref:Aminotransferase n=1 Tax=Yeosuana aromativorans TaxID=288019 RepID=A0A8J3FGP6_9FLAO|nr:DegT/DnrJ/EryC1/StrS family aminotransferase [Yeosuana aromativorans]GGK25599.1 aminotransferase [Yeosuana aromativorans]